MLFWYIIEAILDNDRWQLFQVIYREQGRDSHYQALLAAARFLIGLHVEIGWQVIWLVALNQVNVMHGLASENLIFESDFMWHLGRMSDALLDLVAKAVQSLIWL